MDVEDQYEAAVLEGHIGMDISGEGEAPLDPHQPNRFVGEMYAEYLVSHG